MCVFSFFINIYIQLFLLIIITSVKNVAILANEKALINYINIAKLVKSIPMSIVITWNYKGFAKII